MGAAAAQSAFEVVLRRERVAFVAGMVAVVVVAWTWVLLGAGMDMTASDMTRMAGMDGQMMQPARV